MTDIERGARSGGGASPGLVVALLAVVVLLAGTTVWFARDEYQELAREADTPLGGSTAADEKIGPGRLRIPEAEQRASGIVVVPLVAAGGDAAVEATGVVLDLAPLIESRVRRAAHEVEARTARAAAAAAETEYRRAQTLFEDDRNVSERAVLAARAEWQAARDRVAAAETAARGVQDSARAQWGAALATAAFGGDDGLRPFVEQREVVVQIAVSNRAVAAALARPVAIAALGSAQSTRARCFARAPTRAAANAGAFGTAVLCRANADGLAAGTRVVARVAIDAPTSAVTAPVARTAALPAAATTGTTSAPAVRAAHDDDDRPAMPRGGASTVVIPESAVVWLAGRPWVWLRSAPDIFERRPVQATQLTDAGWIEPTGFAPGDEVVVTGAQLLLSEELEYQIRNENED
jgi:hypothetical protein